MSLKDRIGEDMKNAMRARDADRLSAIRMLVAAVRQREIDERIELDDAQTITVVERLSKQRRDSIEQYEQAGRHELAAREKFELDVLAGYLPQAASAEEVSGEIDAAIAATSAASLQDIGKVMGMLKQRLAGRADLSKVSAQVRERLSAPRG
ncbi:MAG: GatB/YqeY domain-containing protein [Burkholderiaceae bacterium]|nr:GatB/YqeY domain-containing protein [Burkholderiaceae bacterium]